MVVTPNPDTMPFDTMRRAMVASQLRPNAVDDAGVVAAMAVVPREAFVPAALRHQAYRDSALPLGGGRALNPPIATGRLLTQLGLQPDERVLVIGGAGYAAAVAAKLAGSVVAVEQAPLAEPTGAALADQANVTFVAGGLAEGAPDVGPYDAILIDGAVERVPDTLLAQLKPGGRIATGLLDRGVTRLAIGVRTEGGFGLNDFADIECAVLPGFAPAPAFTF